MDDNINELVIAVVQRAVDDWRYLCKGGKPSKWRNFEELEYFFKNDCETFLVGTSISHTRLLDKMMREKNRALKRLEERERVKGLHKKAI